MIFFLLALAACVLCAVLLWCALLVGARSER